MVAITTRQKQRWSQVEKMKTEKPASGARSGTSERREGCAADPSANSPYPGRKRQIAKRIISLMPLHERYVEPFAGMADVLRLKRPAIQSIAIDLDRSALAAIPRSTLPAGTTIIRGDGIHWLREHAGELGPETLVYADPPYLRSTRTRRFYDHELQTDQEHSSLLTLLQALRCRVMISGYGSPLYAAMLEQWATERIGSMTRGGFREEWVWMNFRAGDGLQLHDTRFLGKGFRERERIKRKKNRWAKRLAAMEPAERQAIREALDQADWQETT
jgi:hypothetical protein